MSTPLGQKRVDVFPEQRKEAFLEQCRVYPATFVLLDETLFEELSNRIRDRHGREQSLKNLCVMRRAQTQKAIRQVKERAIEWRTSDDRLELDPQLIRKTLEDVFAIIVTSVEQILLDRQCVARRRQRVEHDDQLVERVGNRTKTTLLAA